MKRAASSPPTTARAGAQLADQQVAGRLAAHVQLVAHVQALRGQPEDVDRPAVLEHARQPRPEVVAEEAQPLDRLVVADPEPQRPARALVERRERARADVASSTTQTGIDGEQTPVIGPTWSCSLPGLERDLAAREQRRRLLARRPPSPRTRPRRAARGAAGRRRAPTRSAARRAAACRRAARARPRPAGATVTRPRRAPSIAATARALAAATAAPCRPHSRVSTSSVPASPPAGGRQSTSHDRRALVAQRVGERRRGRGSRPRRASGRQLSGSCASALVQWPRWQIWTRWSRRSRPRPACSASATSRSSSASAPASTATTPRSSRTATGSSSSAARRSRRRSCSPTRSAPARAAVVTNVSDVRAMGGRPLGVVDMLVSPDRAHAETVLDGIALGVGHARRPGRRRAPHDRPRARAVGVLHRLRDGARCGRPPREPGDVLLAAFATDGRYMSDTQRRSSPRCTTAPDACCKTDGEALVEVAEQRPLPRRARRLDAGHRRLAAADDRGRGHRRDARRRRPPAARRRRRSSAGC